MGLPGLVMSNGVGARRLGRRPSPVLLKYAARVSADRRGQHAPLANGLGSEYHSTGCRSYIRQWFGPRKGRGGGKWE
jgi:hypothetical protein